jgi:hypothetical protein
MWVLFRPMNLRSPSCKRSRRSISTSQNQFLGPRRDAEGRVIIRRQLKYRHVLAFFQKLSPCFVEIEACASSGHWSRALKALGHTRSADAAGVRL